MKGIVVLPIALVVQRGLVGAVFVSIELKKVLSRAGKFSHILIDFLLSARS
jgi:hypothetical protein